MIKSGNKEQSKSTSWKVLETVMSHLKTASFWLYFDALKIHSWFSRKHSYRFYSNFAIVETSMSGPRSRGCISKNSSGGKFRSYVRWGMASFCRYGNSDLAEKYPIWSNFHLSLARLGRLMFCWTNNGGALVAQSWTVSVIKNPIDPP